MCKEDTIILRPLEAPHRSDLRATLESEIGPEGAAAVLAAIPASEAEMPATKDLVRAEANELRADVTDRFAAIDESISGLRLEMAERFAATDESISRLRLEMTERFGQVDARFAEVDAKIDNKFTDLHIRMMKSAIAFTGVIVATIGLAATILGFVLG